MGLFLLVHSQLSYTLSSSIGHNDVLVYGTCLCYTAQRIAWSHSQPCQSVNDDSELRSDKEPKGLLCSVVCLGGRKREREREVFTPLPLATVSCLRWLQTVSVFKKHRKTQKGGVPFLGAEGCCCASRIYHRKMMVVSYRQYLK